jgi:DinB superfamily
MDNKQLFIKMGLLGWETYFKRLDELFKKFSEAQFMSEIAPGRNRGIYLLGHLISVHDRILPVLGLGNELYPQLEKPFLSSPDKSGLEFPSLKELLEYWTEVNQKLADGFKGMTDDQWFQRHSSVSAEDFAKEPHRNKLNIILNRTDHMAYHLGQLRLIK